MPTWFPSLVADARAILLSSHVYTEDGRRAPRIVSSQPKAHSYGNGFILAMSMTRACELDP